ncbi:MAG TPA: penicillin-insensitive murein endopeptidase [Thermoleophilaceae bacterium]
MRWGRAALVALALAAIPAAAAPAQTEPAYPQIHYKRCRSLGPPWHGRLVRGTRLPPEGADFFTWDPARRRTPNRWWRRYACDFAIKKVLRVLSSIHRDFPDAPRIGIGDMSRPRGGGFGPRFGALGHASHQNGVDIDVYYPRLDGLERAPRDIGDIDLDLAQELVDRFVRAGAQFAFVGPHTGLEGPPKVVQVLANHDDHVHVRFRVPRSRR